jgi:hypothetical protein
MMARSANDIPHSRSVKRALVALTGFLALALAFTVIEPYLPTETEQDLRAPRPSPAEAAGVMSVIRSAGYACSGVFLIEPAVHWTHKGITVLCKDGYTFLVENHGGRLIVTSQSDWY